MIDLRHGDCIEIMRTIPDGSIDCVLTDPPYGTTACKWDSVIPFDLMWAELKRVTKPNGAIVLFGSEPFSSALRMSNIKNYKYDWIWNKRTSANVGAARFQPLKVHENVIVFNGKYTPQMTTGKDRMKGGKVSGGVANGSLPAKYQRSDQYHPKSILDIKSERGAHPTQKPVPLMAYLVRTYTQKGETVLDFTMGSGTTGVACVQEARAFIGIERDDVYFKAAQERITDAARQGAMF